jgi:hypothetical protein
MEYVTRSIFDQQGPAGIGRKLDPKELTSLVGRLFMQDSRLRSTLFGIDTGSANMRLFSMKVDDIPTDSKATITKELQAQGVSNPTGAQLLQYYWFKKNKGTL